MSLFNRKFRGKSHRNARPSTAELVAALFPAPRAVPVPAGRAPVVAQASRRRRTRHPGYFQARARQPMFRVT
jgi:hypothetical protein